MTVKRNKSGAAPEPAYGVRKDLHVRKRKKLL